MIYRPIPIKFSLTIAIVTVGLMAWLVSDSGAQTSTCFAGGPPCPPLGATVSITIDSGGGGGGGGSGGIRASTLGDVNMAGRGFAGGTVTLLVDGGVAASFLIDSSGQFSRTLPNIPAGIHTFSARGTDALGRTSLTVSVSLSVAGGTVTYISGLILPPTIEAGPSVASGQPVLVSGQSFPKALVYLFFTQSYVPAAQVTADGAGRWNYSLDTALLSSGVYQVRARAQTFDGEQSEFSQSVNLVILPPTSQPPPTPIEEAPFPPAACQRGDLNNDGRVDLKDFSILLYWWGSSNPCADSSGDGTVNLVDLSIMLYWWTE